MAYLDRSRYRSMKYYDLKKHWTKKIGPFLDDTELNSILVRDFNKYTIGQRAQPFRPDQYPADIENGDWGFGHYGPRPRYWRYIKFGTCHWIANFALRLATLVEPLQQWQIVSSDNGRSFHPKNTRQCGMGLTPCSSSIIRHWVLTPPPVFISPALMANIFHRIATMIRVLRHIALLNCG